MDFVSLFVKNATYQNLEDDCRDFIRNYVYHVYMTPPATPLDMLSGSSVWESFVNGSYLVYVFVSDESYLKAFTSLMLISIRSEKFRKYLFDRNRPFESISISNHSTFVLAVLTDMMKSIFDKEFAPIIDTRYFDFHKEKRKNDQNI